MFNQQHSLSKLQKMPITEEGAQQDGIINFINFRYKIVK